MACSVILAASCSVAEQVSPEPESPLPSPSAPIPSVALPSGGPTGTPDSESSSPSASTAPIQLPLPDGLDDRLWYTALADGSYIVGTLAGTARLKVPAGAIPFAAGSDVVATATPHPDGSQRTIITFVSLDRLMAAPFTVPFVANGIFVNDELILAGGTVDPGSVGLLAIDVTSGATRYVIEPGPRPPGRGGNNGSVIRSPTADTMLFAECGSDDCLGHVLRHPFGGPQPAIEIPGHPRAMSSKVVVFGPDYLRQISGMDLDSGKLLWTLPDADYSFGYVVADAALIQARRVEHGGAFASEILRVDLQSGAFEILVSSDEDLSLWPGLSNDRVAVLGPGGRLEEAGLFESTATVATLDLSTGNLERGALTIALHP